MANSADNYQTAYAWASLYENLGKQWYINGLFELRGADWRGGYPLRLCTKGSLAGNKLEGDWGEIVALGAEISP